jgi:CheY-like chemotaxis protein
MSSVPTVYFIDDSATMREVIKIAFRRENINVVACHDAASALEEIENSRPDLVITDVIMPDKDGYDVCQYIKTHPELKKIPVVLMSGVVNRSVAEKAFAVRADELLRKPFQPQDLITRVKHLLQMEGAAAPTPASAASAAVALTSIFSAASPMPPRAATTTAQRSAVVLGGAPSMAAAGPSMTLSSPSGSSSIHAIAPGPSPTPAAVPAAPIGMTDPAEPVSVPVAKAFNGNEGAKLKVEVARLEGLVKKLQVELQAEREYSRALEAHVKTLQEVTG